jgi:hypothetical protein
MIIIFVTTFFQWFLTIQYLNVSTHWKEDNHILQSSTYKGQHKQNKNAYISVRMGLKSAVSVIATTRSHAKRLLLVACVREVTCTSLSADTHIHT